MSRAMTVSIAIACVVVLTAPVAGQTGPTAQRLSGHVSADNVYVRSGAGSNYYPMAKLNTGDRVTILGEESGWYAIAPPKGCFNLIHKDYVDVGAAGKGVVNGNAVLVRAGSDLDPGRYAVLLKLDKGAEVQILDTPADDDYHRIVPPAGSRSWISADYVVRPDGSRHAPAAQSGDHVTATEHPGSGAAEADSSQTKTATIDAVATDAATADATAASSVPAVSPEQAAKQETEHRKQLETLEVAVKTELAKPLVDRQFEPIIEQYRAIASGGSGRYCIAFAQARIVQIESLQDTASAVKRVRRTADELTVMRKEHMEARANLRPINEQIERAFDVEGELRESMVWAGWTGPQRYRLIDTSREVPRTLCYVEIPPESKIDARQFLGRTVGVWAFDKYVETGDVDPIPIIVAEKIVALGTPSPPELADAGKVDTISERQ